MAIKSFDDRLLRDLRDPEFATASLNDALEDSTEELLMLSGSGNPEFRSVHAVLKASGLGIGVTHAAQELAA